VSTLQANGIASTQSVTRLRNGEGIYLKGRYVEGLETSTQIDASVQNYVNTGSAEPLSQFGGQRNLDWKVLYCQVDSFRISDDKTNTEADRIVFNNSVYEVKLINTWEGQILTHDEVFAVRIGVVS